MSLSQSHVGRCMYILQLVSLLCISIIFAYRMMPRIERYVLPKPKEECVSLFVICIVSVGIAYFIFHHYCFNPIKNKFMESFWPINK